jgi:hypothetical protein
MTEWAAVKLTDARQVGVLAGFDPLPEPVAAADHYAALRDAGQQGAAMAFIGHALPRLEVVAWAARLIDAESRRLELGVTDRQALDHALRWLDDADEDTRRAAYNAAQAAGERAPERLLGLAVFFSGGSISLPDLPPVLPPPEGCARFATTAVLLAAQRSGDPDGFVAQALALAEGVATRGMDALQPA